MFFAAFYSSLTDMPNWKTVVQKYSRWLGLKSTIRTYHFSKDRQFSLCFMHSIYQAGPSGMVDYDHWSPITLSSSGRKIEAGTTIDDLEAYANNSIHNDILIHVALHNDTIKVLVPFATPEQFYYSQREENFWLGNDLRLMAYVTQAALDEKGVFSLFQFLTIPAPLTLFENVQRIPGGYCLEISLEDQKSKLAVRPANFTRFVAQTRSDLSTETVESKLCNIFDSALLDSPIPKTLYFSGGVDSSLLLARLLQLGVQDLQLVNFSFGNHDREANLANEIAAFFKLKCLQVSFQFSEVTSVLERVIKDYSYPFGDPSVIPTNMLVHMGMRILPETKAVIDGTGADGLFAVGNKYGGWNQIYTFPRLSRGLVSECYRGFAWWQKQSKAEYIGRLARRSVQMPIHQAAIMAQNALDGIAYHIPPHIRQQFDENISDFLLQLLAELPEEEQFALVDVTHICAGQFAAKTFDPLRHYGVKTIYPYLSPKMICYSSSLPWALKSSNEEPKALLKKLLLRDLPHKFIYRPKSGFNPPSREILADAAVREFIDEVVLSENNPLLSYCDVATVQKIMNQVTEAKLASVGVYNFAWLFIFTSAWLSQLIDNRPR